MIYKLIGLFDRLLMKFKRYYWKNVLSFQIGQKLENCRVYGRVTVLNNNVKIGKNVTFYPNTMLFGNGEIRIGNNVALGNNTVIYAHNRGGVSIGDDTMIAANCYIIDSNHGICPQQLIREQELDVEQIILGKDVWIGAGCHIIKGACIEDGAVIGANSVVNSFVSSNVIAVGSPAKTIKRRI